MKQRYSPVYHIHVHLLKKNKLEDAGVNANPDTWTSTLINLSRQNTEITHGLRKSLKNRSDL